jgi:hypothetical protein
MAQAIPNKGQKMNTETKTVKTVEISELIFNAYSDLAGSARDAMVYFVHQSRIEIEAGRVSVRVGRDSIKKAIETNGAISDIAPSNFDHMELGSILLDLEGSEKQTVKNILKTAGKLQKLTSKPEAITQAKRAKNYAEIVELVEELKDDAEATKQAEAEAETEELLATAITFETMMDGVLGFFKGKNIQDLTTTELAKTEQVLAILHTVAKNTKAQAKTA